MVAVPTTSQPSGSLTEHVALYPVGAPVAAAYFLGKAAALIREDGTIVLGSPEVAQTIAAHADGAVLSSASTGKALVTGGDDGLIVATTADGARETLHDAGGKWIDALAARDDGAVAWSTGKRVGVRDAKGLVKTVSVPTTARGLAFAPKGYRLAIAHYNGASLWFPNTESPPDVFEWKGSHVDITFSPDGRFAVTTMQENALHGWRIADKANMRMSGYPAKVKSLAWSADGAWLATSGADSCVVWPFRDKDGPMNKAPRECAVRKAKVSKVAFNPKTLLLAIGYEDGWILLCRLADGTELLVRRPDGDRHVVTALAWNADGTQLLFGTAGGEAGLLHLPQI
jgi:WD40 repeat protein